MDVTNEQQVSLMERSVVYVCRGVVLGGRRGISAAAFSKRVSHRYRWLREYGNIPKHRRPSLRTSCLRGLIAFTYALPRGMRLTDALEGVFVRCMEYYRPERRRRLSDYDPGPRTVWANYDIVTEEEEEDMPWDY